MNDKPKYHYWVGNVSGHIMVYLPSGENKKPVPKPGERLKYLGFTHDVGFPKKMSTGRVLYKPNTKSMKKKKLKQKG